MRGVIARSLLLLASAAGCELVGGIMGEREVTRQTGDSGGAGAGGTGAVGAVDRSAGSTSGAGGTSGDSGSGGTGGASGSSGVDECKVMDAPCTSGFECCTGYCDKTCSKCPAGKCEGALLPGETAETRCEAGYCAVVLAQAETSPTGIAADLQGVYWTNASSPSGSVRRLPLSDGMVTAAPPIETIGVADGPLGIAIDPGFAYWGAAGSQEIWELKRTSGEIPKKLASTAGKPQFLATSATHVFWTSIAVTDTGEVEWVPNQGGTPKVIYTTKGAGYGIAVSDSATDSTLCSTGMEPAGGGSVQCWDLEALEKKWEVPAVSPSDVVITAGFAYWAEPNGLLRAGLDTGKAEQGLPGPFGSKVYALASDGAKLYMWLGSGIHRLDPTSPTSSNKVVADGAVGPGKLAVAGKFVYWTETGTGRVMRGRR